MPTPDALVCLGRKVDLSESADSSRLGASIRQLLNAVPILGRMVNPEDRGARSSTGFRIGRPANRRPARCRFTSHSRTFPADLDGVLALHGVGPKAVRLLQQARTD